MILISLYLQLVFARAERYSPLYVESEGDQDSGSDGESDADQT